MQLAHMYAVRDDGMGLFGPFFSLLFLVLIVLGIVLLVKAISDKPKPPVEGNLRDPLDIARERYAKGEITKDELADIKKELGKK
ncbi:MAG TPA: SHOCT domain-containing protein [Candidatus Saccharibacteria bacterium]|nr:SHOCT domain-containing protein [Candidatus Saccharibacteria bacterium]